MNDDWSAIRRQLGPEYAYAPGHWFCVAHTDVRVLRSPESSRLRAGDLFSDKPTRGEHDGRRIVLASLYGPNASLYARSASRRARFEHPAHAHNDGQDGCRLDRTGWLDFRIVVGVPSTSLNDETFSCEEPKPSELRAHLEQALVL